MKPLYEKILDVISEIPSLRKEGVNQKNRYNYVTEANVLKVVKPILLKHKIMVTTEIVDQKIENGINLVSLKHAFVCAENGAKMEFSSMGSGYDAQDKGLYKAITGSLKYFLIKNLLIETDENLDPEYDGAKVHSKKELDTMAKRGEKFPSMNDEEIVRRQEARERRQEKVGKIDATDDIPY